MKIVAIGGGNNSNQSKDGTPKIYEHYHIMEEIIKLTGKHNPNVLIVPHASSPDELTGNLFKMISVLDKIHHCFTKIISHEDLDNDEMQNGFLDWADIIYVLGGNTKQLMDIWHKTGFDEKLKDLANTDKVLCGTSAGAGCWFKYTCSDYLQMETGSMNAPLMPVEGLGLVDLVFNPHANYEGRMKGIKDITEKVNLNGLSLTNNMAIVIEDDSYRLIEGKSSEGLSKEAILSYWKDGSYYCEPVPNEGLIEDLTRKRLNKQKKKKR